MKKFIILSAAFLLFSSHDMFLKMGTYFLQPNTPATIKLFNGTFEKSENVIARSRMRDVCLLGNGVRTNPDTTAWSESDSVTILNFKTGEAGTWVAGLSTHVKNIELKAKEFNEYLEHDGVLDMLEWRKKNNALGEKAVEKYSKHVKAIFQVGDKKTNDWQTVLGYPIEFLPQRNPYDLTVGNTLNVKLLRNGQPLPSQLVYVGGTGGDDHQHKGEAHGHKHAEGEEHKHNETKMQTDANGMVALKIDHEGQYFLRTIHMVASQEAGLTHESNWATLTFEVGHGHSHGDGEGHHHGGTPKWMYWAGALAVLGGLFLFFRKRRNH